MHITTELHEDYRLERHYDDAGNFLLERRFRNDHPEQAAWDNAVAWKALEEESRPVVVAQELHVDRGHNHLWLVLGILFADAVALIGWFV